MAIYDFDELDKKYNRFDSPIAVVKINNKELPSSKKSYGVTDYDIELTCGFEASIASFSIVGAYDNTKSEYDMDGLKDYIMLGSKVEIYLGYENQAKHVFTGLIAKVNYQFEPGDMGVVRITAMDAKCVMMAGVYSRQLKATGFVDAVKEIFEKSNYQQLKSNGIIDDSKIGSVSLGSISTPGLASESKDVTIEMVAESDYEFIVKMAKRNNYEFYIDCGTVIFRKAKGDKSVIMKLVPRMGIQSFDIEYDITAIAETVFARATNANKGEVMEAKGKFSNKISIGNKAKNMIKGSQKIYIDPTITTKDEAQDRVDSLMEEMSYRYGTLYMDIVGLPELKPGYYLDLQSLGTGPSNIFYIVNVQHILRGDGKFFTRVTARTNAILG